MENRPEGERQSELQQLAANSWNLELIISGAAVFLASYLPGVVNRAQHYFLNNLATSESPGKNALPLLAYTFGEIIAWLLVAAFVCHFIMRAFWAGLVGLHAVYPEGIKYEQLPGQTDFSREQARKRFGRLDDYILRMDRLCNQVFSAAFLAALYGLGISFAYLLVFSMMHLVPLFIPGETGKLTSIALLMLFVLIALLPAIFLMLLRNKRFTDNRRLQYWSDVANWITPRIVLPLVFHPINYLNLTFSSNVPRKRFYATLTVMMVLLFSVVLYSYFQTMLDLSGRTGSAFHTYFAQGAGANLLDSRRYDNLRPEGQALPKVSIPADVVFEPFLRVFVTYPKALDGQLAQVCTPAVFPDSLPRSVRRHIADSLHLQCFSQFFRVSINDSLLAPAAWIFHQHPTENTRGLLTYLPTGQFRPGKNILLIQAPSEKKADSLRVYGVVPFWYAPK
ncbi:MAG: hypothetical protein IPM98_07895 [Lewinellaceae bacterium]|nr:hypothetical protein [Lewinellaceae bacterium]